MKLIQRMSYISQLESVKNIPDIKVITGIRRSGKSKLLDAFSSLISKEDNSNVVRINLNQKQYKKLLNADNLYEYIEKHVAGRDNYLFIDEILCEMKHVDLIEGRVCVDHIHMYVAIPPKLSMYSFRLYDRSFLKYLS